MSFQNRKERESTCRSGLGLIQKNVWVGTSIGIMRGGDGCGFGGGGVGGVGKPTSTQACLFLRLMCPCLLVSIFLDYMAQGLFFDVLDTIDNFI